MKILLTGASGQLGHSLRKSKPKIINGEKYEFFAFTRKQFDLSVPASCKSAIIDLQPDWVINAGAFTAVEKAESNPDLVMSINSSAPRAIAEALLETGGQLIQLSTDFVFGGDQGIPYTTNDLRKPLNLYGISKAKGEEAIEEILIPQQQGIIVRTSWLMGPVGKNFALTMIKLHKKLPSFKVVADQIGSPTSTETLANACWQIIKLHSMGKSIPNVIHWSDAGAASWFDVALEIGAIGQELGIIKKASIVKPISTKDYKTNAVRPYYSLLDCFDSRKALELEAIPWKESLKQVLALTLLNN